MKLLKYVILILFLTSGFSLFADRIETENFTYESNIYSEAAIRVGSNTIWHEPGSVTAENFYGKFHGDGTNLNINATNWSLFPAITNVNMNTNQLVNVSKIQIGANKILAHNRVIVLGNNVSHGDDSVNANIYYGLSYYGGFFIGDGSGLYDILCGITSTLPYRGDWGYAASNKVMQWDGGSTGFNRSTAFATLATGTPSSTTYLRGDGSWATIATNGSSTNSGNATNLDQWANYPAITNINANSHDITNANNVYADYFWGDGSHLTGLTNGGIITTGSVSYGITSTQAYRGDWGHYVSNNITNWSSYKMSTNLDGNLQSITNLGYIDSVTMRGNGCYVSNIQSVGFAVYANTFTLTNNNSWGIWIGVPPTSWVGPPFVVDDYNGWNGADYIFKKYGDVAMSLSTIITPVGAGSYNKYYNVSLLMPYFEENDPGTGVPPSWTRRNGNSVYADSNNFLNTIGMNASMVMFPIGSKPTSTWASAVFYLPAISTATFNMTQFMGIYIGSRQTDGSIL